ncbi:MAG: methyltransferase domain-containing protein [Spirochaetaceae bacterium]|jgi:2-polyprenyl-3-methyl-5-hydroxy-6-metoxy-1,4-benzoquinol methylase/spore coat polysaccharide biosynthesis predicted glycosyltransferase SpsG|nr:methyltransferase domain-containing protein [Spirochaetaceae bacterium]
MKTLLPILIAASFEKNRGGGHLVRSASLVRDLNMRGLPAYLFLSGKRCTALAREIAGDDIEQFIISGDEIEKKQWKFVICDRFKTPADEFFFFQKLAPLIGIDEGGPCRASFDFLIDLLPLPPERGIQNLLRPSLLNLPKKRKDTPFAPLHAEKLKVLISFGTEDKTSLALRAAELCASRDNIEITLIEGALHNSGLHKIKNAVPYYSKTEGKVSVVKSVANLRETFASYDLIITHFGLSAFESIYAGTPVVLFSPTAYHKKLASSAGFFTADNKLSLDTKTLETIRMQSAKTAEKYQLDSVQKVPLAQYIGSAQPHVFQTCPLCGKTKKSAPVLARFSERTYRRCRYCKNIFMERLTPPPIEYSDEYFFDFYKKQYGKTYLEDFPHLIALSKQRLDVIKKLIGCTDKKRPQTSPRLLDIGCAYGAFLAAAKEEGFSATGIDPSQGAVNYVNNTLHIPAHQAYFPQEIPFDHSSSFDIITLWYVIEHFENPASAIKAIHKLLKKDGLFAFSTPSTTGVSSLFFKQNFLKNSPADHRTIWTPHSAKKLLRKSGFFVKKIIITGHHPERFPLVGRFLHKKESIPYQLFMKISIFFGLGDTFELYALKIGGPNP